MTPKIDKKTMHQQKQNLQSMHQSSLFYQFLKKFIQFSISFSVCSLVFSYPSWNPFFHSFISHLHTFSSQVCSLATDKNYIFLLCNGILVFIAKYSSHTVNTCPPSPTETSTDDELYYKAEDMNENRIEENEVLPEENIEEKHVVYQITDGTLRGEENEQVINNDDEKEFTNEYYDNWSFEEQEEDNYGEEQDEAEQEEESIAKMSTEELNRKFEDFIKKMKEDIRIEARQQLIMV